MYLVQLICDDFLHGAIWMYDEERYLTSYHPLISNDPVLQKYDEKTLMTYSSYYECDSHDQACWFNHEQRKKDAKMMLGWINIIKARLDEINDGSYVVEDLESKVLMKIIEEQEKEK